MFPYRVSFLIAMGSYFIRASYGVSYRSYGYLSRGRGLVIELRKVLMEGLLIDEVWYMKTIELFIFDLLTNYC